MTLAALPDDPPPRLYALVPCAGQGSRSGLVEPKQYAVIEGRSLLAHALAALAAVRRLAGVLVVVSPGDRAYPDSVAGTAAWVADCGGATRAQSVGNGLAELLARGAQESDWVLVHDAARCLVQPAWIDRLIDACRADEVGGLLALPVADTLKAAQADRVVQTIDRQAKWQAQTPQMFRIGLLQKALAHAGPAVTDEASAVEALGLAPRLVPGALENFKITWPADFELAARLLRTRT